MMGAFKLGAQKRFFSFKVPIWQNLVICFTVDFDVLKVSNATPWKQMCLAEKAVVRHYSGAQ